MSLTPSLTTPKTRQAGGWSTQRKLIISIALIFVLLCAAGTGFGWFILRTSAINDKEQVLASQLDNIADSLNSLSRERESLAVSLARRGEFLHSLMRSGEYSFDSNEDEERFVGKLLAREVESFPFIEGAGLYYEPFTFNEAEKFRGFYAHWVPPIGMSRKVEFTMKKSTAQADYQNSGWYRSLIPNGWDVGRHLYSDSMWSSPYRDPVTLVPILSIMVAMYSDELKLIGLSSVDWNLDTLTEQIDASRPTKNSIAALFSPDTKTFAAVAGLQGLSLEPIEKAPWMPYLLFNAPDDRYEMVKGVDENNLPIRVYSRVLTNGMVYGVVVPEHEIFAGVTFFYYEYLAVLAGALVLGAFILCLIVRYYLGDLSRFAAIARAYGEGALNNSVDVRGGGEMGRLGNSLRRFREYLQDLNQSLLQTTKGELILPLNAPVPDDEVGRSLYSMTAHLKNYAAEFEDVQGKLLQGDAAVRLESLKYEGLWRHQAAQFNALVECFARAMRESVEVLRAAQGGDFNSRIRDPRTGIFEELRVAINGAMETHRKIVKELSLNLQATKVARDEAQLAANAKSQILAYVCEEGQHLTKQVLGCIAALRIRSDETDRQDQIVSIKNSCGMILTLVDELRGFAQIEEGKISVASENFDLRRLLFEIKDAVRPHVIKHRQELSLTIDNDVPEEVCGDASLLESSLLAVLNQSIRYTEEEGTIALRVSLVERTNETFTIKFTCTDSSGGALAAKRAETLAGFNSGVSVLNPSGLGGALGLIITRRIVQLLGGSLNVESRLAMGCQYEIVVPMLIPGGADLVIAPAAQDQAIVAVNAPRALVVEDDIINQKVAVHYLTQQGFHTTTARDGLEALRLVGEQKFNLILMDINLPVLDGLETTKRIRSSHAPYASVPIIAVTANPLRMEEDGSLAEGFNAFLLKPLESRALRELLIKLGIDTKSVELEQMI